MITSRLVLRTAIASFSIYASCDTALAAPQALNADRVGQSTTTSTAEVPLPGQLVPQARPTPRPEMLSCSKTIGIVGTYYEPLMSDFLVAEGHAVSYLTETDIQAGSLAPLDVLIVNRDGVADAVAEALAIETWVRGGGTLITEFDATDLLFDGSTFSFFPAAIKHDCFSIPDHVCGGNTMMVVDPCDILATDVSESWCSADPFGVFKVYDESTLPPQLNIVVRLDNDTNRDGFADAAMGSACIDDGAVVAFFSDFGDWRALGDCGHCARTEEAEQLLRNAVCKANTRCGEQQCSVAVYCTSEPGECDRPQICATGAPSAGATSGFEIVASPVPANTPGVLMYTDAGRACIPFDSVGTLCIGAPRFSTATLNSGGTFYCTGQFVLDMNCFASGNCAGTPQPYLSVPGTRINVQYLFMDGAPFGAMRLSDAGEYVVLP